MLRSGLSVLSGLFNKVGGSWKENYTIKARSFLKPASFD